MTSIEPINIGGQVVYPVDCLEAFKKIGSCSVDNISTSPPYNLGGFHSNEKKRAYFGFSDDMTEQEYRGFIYKVIDECHRVLKPTGSFFLNMKTKIFDGISIPPYWVVANDFNLKQEIIWHYPSTANVDKVRFYPLFEYVFWFIKDPKNFKFNDEWAIVGNVWKINHMTDRNEAKMTWKDKVIQHPAIFPTQLAQATILSTTSEGDTVLDPFVGSGTTLKVCRHYKRKGIGFDKYFSEYEELARKRIMSDKFPETLLEMKKAGKKGVEKDEADGSMEKFMK